jgi:hypothetical protein
MIKLKTLLLESLSEIEYPLAGKKHQQAYAGYAGWKGKIVWMTPDKFLQLVPPLSSPDSEKMKDFEEKMRKNHPIDFLVLWVNKDNDQVASHEGRHRATVAKKLGIEKIPVLIVVYSHKHYDSYPRVPLWNPQQHAYADKADFKRQTG